MTTPDSSETPQPSRARLSAFLGGWARFQSKGGDSPDDAESPAGAPDAAGGADESAEAAEAAEVGGPAEIGEAADADAGCGGPGRRRRCGRDA